MKSRLLRVLGMVFLFACLAFPVMSFVTWKQDVKAADTNLDEYVYDNAYSQSIVDLIKVKKAGTGTDIDGDGTDGGASDLFQMRNYLVGKTDAFYRTQGVSYQYHEGDAYESAACYYVASEQNCIAGIEKADGKLEVLEKYNDGINGELEVKYLDVSAFEGYDDIQKAILPKTVTQLKGNTFKDCSTLTSVLMPGVATLPVVTDEDGDGLDDTKGYTDGNFTNCDGLQTIVVANNFSVLGANFTSDSTTTPSVKVYVDGVNEPRLDMTINTCLEGEIYHYNTNGACGTWKYDGTGEEVDAAQLQHTYGENDVCTNECCQKQGFKGLSFEQNYFDTRTSDGLQVEYLDEFMGEKNVAKITTTSNGSSSAVADVIIDLPKDVKTTAKLRLMVAESDATYIGFQHIALDNTETRPGKPSTVGNMVYFTGSPFVTPNSPLQDNQKNVWMDYELDFSNTSSAYGDRLSLLIQGGEKGGTHTFYISYAVNSEEEDVRELLANYYLNDGYLANFNTDLYESLVHKNDLAGRQATSVSAQKVDSYTDKNGVTETNVVEITTVSNSGNSAVADFIMNMPKDVNSKATVRLLIKQSDATFIGFQNVESGMQAYCGVSGLITAGKALSTEMTDVWMNVDLDYSNTDEGYWNRLMLLVQGGEKEGTHTFYISYVVETDEMKNVLATDLQEGYLADFSSALYTSMVSTTAKTSNVMWLSEFAGEKGVLKVTATVPGTSSASNKYAPIEIELPESHSGEYKLKVYISENTTFSMVGSASSSNAFTSSTGGWLSANPPTKGQWLEYSVTQSENDGYNNQKINIMGYERTAEERTLEIYLAWVKTAETE